MIVDGITIDDDRGAGPERVGEQAPRAARHRSRR